MITVKDIGRAQAPVRRNVASLVGGFVIAAGCFVLWLLVAGQLAHARPGPGIIAAGLAFAAIVGIWTRLADL